MLSVRHRNNIRVIKADAHKLTRRQREAIDLPARPARRETPIVPIPDGPSFYSWFALRTVPNSEAEVVYRLHERGFAAYNPHELIPTRGNRMVRHKRALRQRAILTGIVLFGYPWRVEPGATRIRLVADVPWLEVREDREIMGVIGMGDAPVPLPWPSVSRLFACSGRLGVPRNFAPVIGAEVEVSVGAFEGCRGIVENICEGRVQVTLFGQGLMSRVKTALDVPEAWLMAVEAA